MRSAGKRAFALRVSFDGTGTLHPPKSIVERLDKSVELYEPILVPSRDALTKLIVPRLSERYPAFIYLPVLCKIKDCGAPVDEEAYDHRYVLCMDHYKQVKDER